MTTFSEASAKFALDVFHLLSNKKPFENILFSPTNLTCALGLLLLGSESDTAAQIEKILHWDELTEYKAPGQRRYLVPTRNYDRSGDKIGANDFHRTSPTTAPCSEDVKHRRSPEAVPRGSPTGCRPKPEPSCPRHEVPDYECEKPKGVHTILHKIIAELNKLSMDHELDIANRLYADYSIVFIQKFLYCALKLYLTEVDGVDIQKAPEEVRKLINLWVDVQTHGKVKDLLPKSSFDCHDHLLLVNALYFKGQWELQFDKAVTQEGAFYLSERDSTTAQFMYQRGQYNIGTVEECELQVLEISYKNKELSLFILLPQYCSVRSLQQLEDELTPEKLLEWSYNLKPQEVEVVLPKFRVEKSIEFDTHLDLSNVTNPQKADLSAATTTKGVALTQLVHDTFFEVDEEGGEKAKAPGASKPRRDTVHFVADHPFVYYVLHNVTQHIVIFGQIYFTMTSLSEANAKLAFDVFHRLSKEYPFENIMFSPLNLSTALGVLLHGSQSDREAEREKELHSNKVTDDVSSEARSHPKAATSTDSLRRRQRIHLPKFQSAQAIVSKAACEADEGTSSPPTSREDIETDSNSVSSPRKTVPQPDAEEDASFYFIPWRSHFLGTDELGNPPEKLSPTPAGPRTNWGEHENVGDASLPTASPSVEVTPEKISTLLCEFKQTLKHADNHVQVFQETLGIFKECSDNMCASMTKLQRVLEALISILRE